MGCQKKIAEKTTGKGADYVIGLKTNQETLHDGVAALFASVTGEPGHVSECTGHGRTEKRACRSLPAALLGPAVAGRWAGLCSVVEVSSERCVGSTGKAGSDKRYFISSLEATPERFSGIIRSHWGIENLLHWSLDVQFGEDAGTKRVKNAAQNFGIILKMAINLLKGATSKLSIPRKRLECARSDGFRQEVMRI